MGFLYVCNAGEDSISVIDAVEFKESSRIILNKRKDIKQGPHGIYAGNEKIFIANTYSSTITILNKMDNKVEASYFIGAHCNGIVVCGEFAYSICGELNRIVIFNLINEKIVEQIPCGNAPSSIAFDKGKTKLVISNMESNSISILDCKNREEIENIKVGNYPTKAIFTSDNQYILVSENNLEMEQEGSLAIVSVAEKKVLGRISVGKYPVDLCCNGTQCIISNFGEGTLSVVDLNSFKEIKKIYIGGMPRALLWEGDSIYVGEYYGNLILKMNIKSESKKAIAIGKEPTGMTFG